MYVCMYVCIDHTLNWKEHIKVVSPKVSRAVDILTNTISFPPLEALKALYIGIVEPHFCYCCSVWGCCGIIELSHFQKLQNPAAHIVTSARIDAASKPLLHEFRWKTMGQLVAHELKMMVLSPSMYWDRDI